MRNIFLCFLILCSTSAVADGNLLLSQCNAVIRAIDQNEKAQSGVQAGHCLGMMEGINNTMQILNDSLPKNMKVCFPVDGISNGQAARIVIKYLNDNPERLNENATLLAMLAFAHAYPCK